MITDRDIAVRGIAEGKGPDAKVRDVMSAEVKYCFDDDDVEDVLDNMADIQLRRLAVLNHDKRPVGIVSLSELASNSGTGNAGEALRDSAGPGGQTGRAAGGGR